MRVTVFVKANQDSEAGVPPSEEMLTAMMKYNEELAKAGVLLAGDGLRPSSDGARVHFSGAKRTVVDGPFSETKELVAGYWLWQVTSMDEAIEWAKRCPNPTGEEGVLEIRPVYEADDFDEAWTPETREIDARLRGKLHLDSQANES
ncbi:YciI family protein [Phytoactinopolyspora halotolerans]|uniref:YciI family protein n=1 Tax=Phytoactinopolyspora halotolerans TaxID=1981512 RepID=A0A6L9SCU0_9ACTN|nr:YciI family protein [Phytoactinopolyspora halotolerans]NEE02897.1 YciI family protein [Phytoactinopolyspora halotolerans]